MSALAPISPVLSDRRVAKHDKAYARFVWFLGQVERCARCPDSHIARMAAAQLLRTVTEADVLAVASDKTLARLFYQTVAGFSRARSGVEAQQFATLILSMIPMRWRRGQETPPAPNLRADLD